MAGSDFLQLTPEHVPRAGRTAWLAERLRDAIAEGRVGAGVRLPSSRILAADLGLARGTVVESYRRLSEEGLLEANRGGGTVVTEVVPALAAGVAAPRAQASAGLFPASSGMPDLSAFPRAAWLRAERAVLATAATNELGYADPQGVPALRASLAGWLSRSRGMNVVADQIIVTSGVTGALSLLSQTLRDRGASSIAVEDPGAEGNRRVLGYWWEDLVPIPVDEQGLDTDALARSDARIVLTTPAHQFPSGVVLSPERRRALVAWAESTESLVIEDDYDAEYRYDRSPVRALHALAPDRIVHLGSVSKVLAPGLRIGWMIAPAGLRGELVRRRWASDLGSPVLPQLTLATLIDDGTFERQLRVLRVRHKARRDAAMVAIGRYFAGCTVSGVAAGLHLVIELPAHIDDAALAERARAEGIDVHPVSRHRFAPGPPGLLIGYGPHAPAKLERALSTLGGLAGLRRGHRTGAGGAS